MKSYLLLAAVFVCAVLEAWFGMVAEMYLTCGRFEATILYYVLVIAVGALAIMVSLRIPKSHDWYKASFALVALLMTHQIYRMYSNISFEQHSSPELSSFFGAGAECNATTYLKRNVFTVIADDRKQDLCWIKSLEKSLEPLPSDERLSRLKSAVDRLHKENRLRGAELYSLLSLNIRTWNEKIKLEKDTTVKIKLEYESISDLIRFSELVSTTTKIPSIIPSLAEDYLSTEHRAMTYQIAKAKYAIEKEKSLTHDTRSPAAVSGKSWQDLGSRLSILQASWGISETELAQAKEKIQKRDISHPAI